MDTAKNVIINEPAEESESVYMVQFGSGSLSSLAPFAPSAKPGHGKRPKSFKSGRKLRRSEDM